MKQSAIFAGSFNPFTLGHYDIALRASQIFDTLYVAVAEDTGDKSCAELQERKQIAVDSLADIKNVRVITFSGMLTDCAKSVGAMLSVRGLRTSADFEYEKSLSEVYRRCGDLESVFIISSPQYSHISGSVVRSLARLNGNLEGYVCERAKQSVYKVYSR